MLTGVDWTDEREDGRDDESKLNVEDVFVAVTENRYACQWINSSLQFGRCQVNGWEEIVGINSEQVKRYNGRRDDLLRRGQEENVVGR